MAGRREEVQFYRPYMLVLHPKSGQFAVYNPHYQLLFEGTSEVMIQYAKTRNTKMTTGFTLTLPEQQPTWMSPEIRGECVCYHFDNE